jgi:hypothetical protein
VQEHKFHASANEIPIKAGDDIEWRISPKAKFVRMKSIFRGTRNFPKKGKKDIFLCPQK